MASPDLKMYTEQVGNVTVVTIEGPVDSATIEQFRLALDPLAAKPGAHVLLDCEGLTYINSRGLDLLARCHRTCFSRFGWFALCNVNRKLVRTMDLLGLGTLLKFYESRDQALAAKP
ncbi:MAG: STAS domain-containing protein [Verrucomicrobia bacterium]|nr:STAS domain-containing protein [Verrucomicrobiota bacterium]